MVTFPRDRKLSASAFRRALLRRTSSAFPEVSNTVQTTSLIPGDDGQRLIVVAVNPGVDCPHVAQGPMDQIGAALPAPSSKESSAPIFSGNAFAVFDKFPTPSITAHQSGCFLGMNRPPKQPACSEVAF
jgi:hypothetical protein